MSGQGALDGRRQRFRKSRQVAASWGYVTGLLLIAIFWGIPGLKAAFGFGQLGTFTAQRLLCQAHGCWWFGDFTGGHVMLHLVYLSDAPSGMQAGSRVPAIYTGSVTTVYANHYTWDWLWFAMPVLLLATMFVQWIRTAWKSRKGRPATARAWSKSGLTNGTQLWGDAGDTDRGR